MRKGHRKTHCRCRRCGARRVLRRHPEHYLRLPRCRTCGSKDYRPDRWMNTRRLAVCPGCSGYHFYHRQGSLYYDYRADGTRRRYGDPDYRDRYLENHPDAVGNLLADCDPYSDDLP